MHYPNRNVLGPGPFKERPEVHNTPKDGSSRKLSYQGQGFVYLGECIMYEPAGSFETRWGLLEGRKCLVDSDDDVLGSLL